MKFIFETINKLRPQKINFKPTLSRVQQCRCTAVFKWRTRVQLKYTMHNGGNHYTSADAIIIRRVDVHRVHDYAQQHCSLKHYLFIRLPMKIGLRTGEIASLKIENINFQNYSFQVLDSKKKRLYPLPLDAVTLQLIQDLIENRAEGYVFAHTETWKHLEDKPLSNVYIWQVVKATGEKAGVQNFSPRLVRHFFAATWAIVEKKSIEGLRRILRHKNLSVTHRYLSRLVFFEDIQQEYQQMQQPFMARQSTSPFYQKYCSNCIHEPTCKLVDQASSNPWATGCRFYKQKKEEMQHV